ncbi:MAG: DUF3344 domain-containing protein, partial [Methanosarcinales archaeon]
MRYTIHNTTLIFILSSVLIAFLISSASAGEWYGSGQELYTIASGKIHGGIYINGGHGYSKENPYLEYFEVPKGVKYARLYVPMWNYNKGDTVDVVINNISLKTRYEPDYVAAWGVSCYVYNATDYVKSGINKVEVYYKNPNGAPYAVILIAVYEDPTKPVVQFWITEGNYALSKKDNLQEDTVQFKGTIDKNEVNNATLWTVIIAGTPKEKDELYFNSQLLGEDVGRAKSGAYFDFDSFNVTPYLISSNNTVKFVRREEIYIHPFNAVLGVHYKEGFASDDYIEITEQKTSTGPTIPLPVIAVLALTIIALVFLYLNKRKKKRK